MKEKKILITGGAGYIGDAVVKILNDIEWVRPCVLDNLTYGGSYMRDVDFIRTDITDWVEMEMLLEKGDFHAVIHLAAIVGDGACAVDPERTIEVNEFAAKCWASMCSKTNTKFIFASTCSVYGANNELLTEHSETNPLSLYAGTKLNAEKYIRATMDDYVIFRLGTLFGMSTEHARIRCDLVANILTYKAALGHKLTVFGGEQWRPLLHVQDAAEAFANAAIGEYDSGTYNLSRRNITISDLADLIVKEVGAGEVVKTESKFEDLRNYKVDTAKAILAAGFNPGWGIANGIADMARVMKEGRIADVWSSQFHNAKYIKEKHG